MKPRLHLRLAHAVVLAASLAAAAVPAAAGATDDPRPQAPERHMGPDFRPTPGRDLDPPLFLDAEIPQNAHLPHDLYDGVLSSRPVRLNAAALDPAQGANRALDLVLTNNRRFMLVLDSCEVRAPDNFTWRGHVDGWTGSDIVLACYKDAVAAEITLAPLWQFSLRYLGEGLHVLTEIDPFKPWRCGTTEEPVHFPGAKPTLPPQGGQDIDYIGVTILYPQVVQNLSGGPSGIAAHCQLCIDQTNDALSNSWSDKRVSLLWHAVIPFTESDNYSDMLSRFSTDATARDYRFANGADLVALLTSRVEVNGTSVTLGKANLMSNGPWYSDCNNTDRCWSVSNYRAATDSYTFAHELGHNFGCGHGYGDGGGVFAASQGYRFDINAVYYHTLMAYDETGGFRIRIKHFSNPDVQYSGTFGSRHPTGDNDHANAWTINTTGAHVAAYRHVLGTIYGKPPDGGNYNGMGSSTCPYRDFNSLERFLSPGGTMRLYPGSYAENPTFDTPMTLELWAGFAAPATIGSP